MSNPIIMFMICLLYLAPSVYQIQIKNQEDAQTLTISLDIHSVTMSPFQYFDWDDEHTRNFVKLLHDNFQNDLFDLIVVRDDSLPLQIDFWKYETTANFSVYTSESPKLPYSFLRRELYSINLETWDDTITFDIDNKPAYSVVANLASGLIFYNLEMCEIALPYFDLVRQDAEALNSEQINILLFADFYAANCYFQMDDPGTAIQYLSKYDPVKWSDQERNPASEDVLRNLASAYVLNGQYDEGLRVANYIYLDLARKSGSHFIFRAWAYAEWARLYAFASEYETALEGINLAINLYLENSASDPELYVMRGQMYLNLYQWDKSLEDFNTAIELAPDYGDAYFQRGVLYYSILQTGQELRTEALADFRHYLELAPDGQYTDQAREYAAKIEAELAALNE